ncbi:sensor domain-containing protein [Zobellella iuensis]|uniref:Diguanylate cyclase n=1 Tax=Zobellella iuensis TaxID=2803811 RepID=A0ABS1QS55_9GAMM|nr:diguanylate cyclase [Zobellella iuensis]MBL1377372.1 diguanylate cyclase [Zobellella iuensis]
MNAALGQVNGLSMITLDHIECGVILLDQERRVRFWNHWLEQHSGIAAGEAAGRRLEQLFGELPAVLLDAVGDACEHRLSRLLSHQLHPQLLPLRRQASSGAGSPLFHSMLLRPLAESDGLTLVQLHDITNAVRRERHLRDKEQALRKVHQTLSEEKQFIDTVLKTISALVVVTDTYGRIISINRSCEQQTGFSEEEVRGQPLKVLFSIDLLFNNLVDGPREYEEPRPFVCRMHNAAGEQIHIRWTVKCVGDAGQPPRYLIYTGQDITERERADALLRLEREILEMATAGEQPDKTLDHICLALERQLEQCRVAVLRWAADDRLQVSNGPSLPEDFCRRLAELQTDSLLSILQPGLQSGRLQVFVAEGSAFRWQPWLALAQDHDMAGCWLMPIHDSARAQQTLFAVFPRQRIHPSAHEQMVIQRIAHLTSLILERHLQQERIRYLALHDPLTGLANRSLLNEQLLRGIHRGRREQQPFALLFIDLDGFKALNDTHGHDAGDAYLAALGHRLKTNLRATDCCARTGGDEFVVLLEAVADEASARRIAETLLRLLSTPLDWSGHALQVSASIGIALYPEDGDSADALLTRADNAMYGAKARGKGCIERLRG